MNQTGWAIASLALAAVGIAVVWLGWRGRRADDHPICRRCGFDLFGLPQGAAVCSECGASLTAKRATRIGHRRRRSGALAGGLIVLLLALGGLSLVGASRWGSFEINAYKPVWMLAREAMSDNASLRGPAIDELLKRLAAGKVASAQVASLCDQFLAWQADAKRTWVPGWGTFIEAVHRSDALSETKWKQYATNAAEPTVRIRTAVRLGDGLPIALALRPGRVGTTPRSLSVAAEVAGITIGKTFVAAERSPFVSGRIDVSGGAMGAGLVSFAPGAFDTIAAGHHEVTVHVTLKYYNARPANTPPGVPVRLAKRDFDLAVPIEILPTDANPIRVVHEPAFRERVERAIFTDLRDLGVSSPVASQSRQYLEINMRIVSPPVGLAYEVFLQTPSGRSRVFEINAPSNGTSGMSLMYPLEGLSNFPSDHADFVLVPSARAALHSLDAVEMWDGEVMIHNVAVRSTTRPAASQPMKR